MIVQCGNSWISTIILALIFAVCSSLPQVQQKISDRPLGLGNHPSFQNPIVYPETPIYEASTSRLANSQDKLKNTEDKAIISKNVNQPIPGGGIFQTNIKRKTVTVRPLTPGLNTNRFTSPSNLPNNLKPSRPTPNFVPKREFITPSTTPFYDKQTPIFVPKQEFIIPKTTTFIPTTTNNQGFRPSFTTFKPKVVHKYEKPKTSTTQVMNGILKFGLDTQDLITKNKNSIISPISLSILLSMLTLGSKGYTQHEILDALYFINSDIENHHQDLKIILDNLRKPNRGVELSLSNRFFVSKDLNILKTFTNAALQYYDAKVQAEDFVGKPYQTLDIINEWVNTATRGKIPHFFNQPLSPETKMVGINTVYYNGAWEIPFDPYFTSNKTFYSPSGNKTIPFMVQIMDISHAYDSNIQADIIGLYYKNRKFSMNFIIPEGISNYDVLSAIEYKIDSDYLQSLIKRMKVKNSSVMIPKMRLRYQGFMKPILKKLGITSMFNPSTSNFSNMTTSKSVYVSELIHETVIEITEKGTEATAISSVLLDKSAGYDIFRVDKPVIMFIRDLENDINLFWGKIFDPEAIF